MGDDLIGRIWPVLDNTDLRLVDRIPVVMAGRAGAATWLVYASRMVDEQRQAGRRRARDDAGDRDGAGWRRDRREIADQCVRRQRRWKWWRLPIGGYETRQ